MPFDSEREHLAHLNDLLRWYPESHPDDPVKLFLELNFVLESLDINDFNLHANPDQWLKIREGLAIHPLKNDGEALCKLRIKSLENKGHWWRNPRNWSTETQTERDNLNKIFIYLSEYKPGGDEWMVANYFHVLEELDRSQNQELWGQIERISAQNFALRSVCWKEYAALTKKYKDEWWWWKLGEVHCTEREAAEGDGKAQPAW